MQKNLLTQVKVSKPNRNSFDLTHDLKLSCNAGKLYPVCTLECLPGDVFELAHEAVFRMAPLVSPLMHRVDVTFHTFFVPLRLLWANFERWITNNQGDDPLPAFPTFDILPDGTNYTELMDYLDIPPPSLNPTADTTETISAMPFGAYQVIYNEFYRDQNLISAIVEPQQYILSDGNNNGNNIEEIRVRAWEHDYFTSALPFAQKGAAVEIPVVADFEDVSVFVDNLTGAGLTNNVAPNPLLVAGVTSPDVPADTLYARTSVLDIEATTINDLRVAFRLQEWLEKQARGGSRYAENILTFFNVNPQDARLNRPEYVCGSKSPIVISEVLQTSESMNTPQGNMAGHGLGLVNKNRDRYFCAEHGYLMTIMSVMPKTSYQQGIPRHFLKYTHPTQLFWPQFEHLGEQEVLNREIYAYLSTGGDTFGYLPRYSEYRVLNNRVSGEFRDSLDFWTWSRKFADLPALNRAFIECTPDYRPFAVVDTEVDHFYAHILFIIKAIRPMGKFGTPTF